MWQWRPKLRQRWEKEELRHHNEKSVTLAQAAKSEGWGFFFFLQEKVTANIELHSDPEEGHSEASPPPLSLKTLLTFLMHWIWFVIYFHYKLLLSALCSNSVFSNVSLCLIFCYIEVFAVRDLTWVVTTWLVFMAAVSEDIWNNQPHAHSDMG